MNLLDRQIETLRQRNATPYETIKERITESQFKDLTRPLIDLPVTKTWRGYGTAIFLELGETYSEPVTRRERKSDESGETWQVVIRERIQGKSSVMIEWSWRVERKYSIAFGSWSGDTKITNRLKKLQNLRIVDVTVEGRLPELVLQLSEGWWVHSFTTVESQPQWCVFVRNRLEYCQWISAKNGKLYLESSLH